MRVKANLNLILQKPYKPPFPCFMHIYLASLCLKTPTVAIHPLHASPCLLLSLLPILILLLFLLFHFIYFFGVFKIGQENPLGFLEKKRKKSKKVGGKIFSYNAHPMFTSSLIHVHFDQNAPT